MSHAQRERKRERERESERERERERETCTTHTHKSRWIRLMYVCTQLRTSILKDGFEPNPTIKIDENSC